MSREHVISDGLFSEAQAEFKAGNHWIAYNTRTYYLDHADMWFFRDKEEAVEFANDNISDLDAYAVIHANSIDSLMRQLPYGENIHFNLTEKELEALFQQFDWSETSYDPLHDSIEAGTDTEKEDLAKMETLLVAWENLYKSNPESALAIAVRYWEGHPMESYKDDFINSKTYAMNEKNFDYLKDNIRNHGFGENLASVLEQQLRKGQTEFTLLHKTEVNKREMEATLYFKKSPDTNMYFFNKYDTRLKNEKDETLSQTFYLNKGWGVTLKEAYNLLNGRAVHKELADRQGEKYQAWIQLDFSAKDKHGNYERKQYHQNYGYDLKEALSYYPVKEMLKEDSAKMLLKSLERGNIQQVTLEIASKEQKVFMEANPQFKAVTLYGAKMQRLSLEQRQELMVKPEIKEGQWQSQMKKEEKDQSLVQEDQSGRKQTKSRQMGDSQGEGTGLIEKKRTNSNKTGLGI